MAKKIIFSVFLTLVVLSSSIYFLMPDKMKILVEDTRTKYYVYDEGWVLAATEYVNLYDGTKKMRASSREVVYWNDSENVYAERTSNWKDNITTIQTYKFNKNSGDIEQFPDDNKFRCINCEGKIVHYEVRDILYDGETKIIENPFSFGNNMKIEWQDGNYYSKVFQQIVSDKIIIKYRPETNDEMYSVRLFDPPGDWTVEGDSVYINDSNIYINITPHTSNTPIIQLKTKQYNGDVDIVIGFNTDGIVPKKAEFNPQIVTVQKEYVCDYEFNYTTAPNYFWCFDNVTTYDELGEPNGSLITNYFEHAFDSGDIPTKTAYWEENETRWTDVSGAFTPANIDYLGYDKWYYKEGFNMNAEELYNLRLTFNPQSMNEPEHKYFFGVKPSSETLQEAITNGHFYFIDPWTAALNTDLISYFKMDDNLSTTVVVDSLGTNNGVLTVNTSELAADGLINTSLDFPHDNTKKVNIADGGSLSFNPGTDDYSVSFWVYRDVAGDYHIPLSDGVAAETSYYFRINSANTLTYWAQDGTTQFLGTTTQTVSSGAWHHIALTVSTSLARLYLDGTNVNNQSVASGTPASDGVVIGTDGSGSHPMNGKIDEIGIWGRTLTSSEITQLNNSGDGISWVDTSEIPPVITSNTTSPDVVYTNTDWKVNITATYNVTYIDSYVQFYVNDSKVGGEHYFNLTNNTDSQVAVLLSGNFSGGEVLIAEVWVGNGANSTKVNMTTTVQYFDISGTLKDSDSNNLNASVFVVDQSDNSLVGNTTSLNGVWTFGPVFPGTYIITGYDPTNSSLDGDASPHVVVP